MKKFYTWHYKNKPLEDISFLHKDMKEIENSILYYKQNTHEEFTAYEITVKPIATFSGKKRIKKISKK